MKILESQKPPRLCVSAVKNAFCPFNNSATLNHMPSTLNISKLLPTAIHAAEVASAEILTVYHSGNFEAEAKGDNSPLTLADRKAHIAISKILESTGLPILSEEGKSIPYDERKDWEYLWIVDPLDGTKEFLKRNDEFTVNIALVHNGKPVLGVVTVPVTGDIYYASESDGAFLKRQGKTSRLPIRNGVDLGKPQLRIVASRSHMNDETLQFISNLIEPELVSKGSSLKFMLLAEGLADVYPRFAPTMEWDTAAAHAVVNAIGLKVLQSGKKDELVYNKPNLLNPYFLVC
jgi:3'(2'), 5'-bisphosphate nucleotidase